MSAAYNGVSLLSCESALLTISKKAASICVDSLALASKWEMGVVATVLHHCNAFSLLTLLSYALSILLPITIKGN